MQVKGQPLRWAHFPCGQCLAVDQGDGRITRHLSPRVIRVQHYNGMHDAAAQQLAFRPQDSGHGEAAHGSDQCPGVESQPRMLKPMESNGDSCRSTRIAAVRRDLPLPTRPKAGGRPADKSKQQHGKADILQRYLADGLIAER